MEYTGGTVSFQDVYESESIKITGSTNESESIKITGSTNKSESIKITGSTKRHNKE